jgi:hypothetical protein
MADHLWHWQGAEEHPTGWVEDDDGWYVCVGCGADDRTADGMSGVGAHCPRNHPTRIYCRCPSQVHAVEGAPQRLDTWDT